MTWGSHLEPSRIIYQAICQQLLKRSFSPKDTEAVIRVKQSGLFTLSCFDRLQENKEALREAETIEITLAESSSTAIPLAFYENVSL